MRYLYLFVLAFMFSAPAFAGIDSSTAPTYTDVQIGTSSGDYTLTRDVDCLELNKGTPEVTTIYLPSNPYDGETHTVKDGAGNASTYLITLTASALIDGETTFLLENDYQSVTVYYNGSTWRVK